MLYKMDILKSTAIIYLYYYFIPRSTVILQQVPLPYASGLDVRGYGD